MQDKVVVIAHQAIGQHLRIKALQALRHDTQQRHPVFVIREDALTPVSARCHMVDSTRELNSQWAHHQDSQSIRRDFKVKT